MVSAAAPPVTGIVTCRAVASICMSPTASGASVRLTASRSAALVTDSSIRSPPTWSLSSSAVPSAITRPWSTTPMRSASRSASSMYWVVSSTVVPAGDELGDDVPQARPGPWVQTGRGLVEEQHRRAGDQRAGQVEPASHASGVALHRAVARLRQVEALQQLAGALLGALDAQVVEAADHLQVLGAGEVVVDGGVLAGRPDVGAQPARVARRRRTRRPWRARRPVSAAWSRSARWSSCRRRSGRAARTPSLRGRSAPSRRGPTTSPYFLTRPSATIASGMGISFWLSGTMDDDVAVGGVRPHLDDLIGLTGIVAWGPGRRPRCRTPSSRPATRRSPPGFRAPARRRWYP